MTGLTDLGVDAAAAAVRTGAVSSVELVAASIERIDATDGALEAWVTVDRDGSLEAAAARDADIAVGRPIGPLHGVPIGVKDIIDVAGLPTRSGAPGFAHTFPARDATLIARLRGAGAVILGKTVATAFAFKDPAPTRNPWSAAQTPGGSSSGSAAAVAARQVPGAVGTQTVGSILRPAAYCGVVGFKGAFGAVPLDGVAPLAPSLDHVGPIARSVMDVALLESVLTDGAVRAIALDPPRLGVASVLLDRAEPELRRHLEATVARLADAGASIVDVILPPSYAGILDAGRVVLEVEAAAVHASMFATHGDAYPPGIASLIRAGLARSDDELAAARAGTARFRADVVPMLDAIDALLAPVAPGPAPLRREGTGDFTSCAPWSFVGVPAMSIPTGLDGTGLPLAIQLVAGPARADRLLGAAAWAERVIGFEARPT